MLLFRFDQRPIRIAAQIGIKTPANPSPPGVYWFTKSNKWPLQRPLFVLESLKNSHVIAVNAVVLEMQKIRALPLRGGKPVFAKDLTRHSSENTRTIIGMAHMADVDEKVSEFIISCKCQVSN